MNTKSLDKQVQVGEQVVYFDEFGREHNALVTAVWGERTETFKDDELIDTSEPSLNVIFISPDERRSDTYGRQVERRSSCMSVKYQAAYGNCYCLPEQLIEARVKINEAKAEYAVS